MHHRLAIALNIREGEGRLVTLLLIHSFFIGMAKIFTSASASAIFVDKFSAQSLPYVYIGVAVVVSLVGLGYTQLEARLHFTSLLVTNLSVLLGGLILFRLLLALIPDTIYPALGLMIWFEVIWAMTSLEFWSLAGQLFDLRQSKRLFGLIGSGDVTAVIISGFAMPTIVSTLGVQNLLFLSMAGLIGSLALLVLITRLYAYKLSKVDQPTDVGSQAKRSPSTPFYRDLFKNHYRILIFGLSAVAIITYYIIDNAFFDQAQGQFDNAAQLAAFVGNFLAASNIVALIARVLVSAPFIERYGLLGGLLSLPVIIVIGGLGVIITGSIWGSIPLIFWLTTGIKVYDSAIRFSIYKSVGLILYQPLSADEQRRLLTTVESFIEPIAGGVAGLLLLFLSAYLGWGAIQLYYALLIIVPIWLILIVLLNREYTQRLVKALAKRQLGGDLLALVDGTSLAVIKQGIDSEHVGETIFSLYVLEEIDHGSFGYFLRRALRHPAPEVRLDALSRIERNNVYSALRNVRLLARYESNVTVRARALRVLAALGGPEIVEEMGSHLNDADLEIRQGALVGLLRSGGIEGILMAGQYFFAAMNSPDPVERRLAAQVLGEVEISSFYVPLLTLLQDKDVTVQKAALIAAGKLQSPQLWPVVVKFVSDPALSATAASILVAGGVAVIPAIKKALTHLTLSPANQLRYIRILGRIQGDQAQTILEIFLSHPDPAIRYRAMNALSLSHYHVPPNKVEQVHVTIKAVVAHLVWILTTLSELDADHILDPLRNALLYEFHQGRDRLFLLLSFIYDSDSILQAREIVQTRHVDPDKQAYALEALDLLLSDTLKRWLLPLFDATIAPAQRLKLLSAHFAQGSVGQSRRLHQIISGSEDGLTPWTVGCALNVVAEKSLVEMQPIIVNALAATHPFIRETALKALATLSRKNPNGYIEKLINDPDPQVSRLAKHLQANNAGNDKPMFLTLEKVLILKSADIFAEVPEADLIGIAAIMEEVEVSHGTTIFEQGDTGTCMYLIASGQIRIHMADQILVELGARDTFGEFALFETQLRTASATALTDSVVLRLDQGPFYELMTDQSEVARGIIRVLIRRLQGLNQRLNISDEQPAPTTTPKTKTEAHQTIIQGIMDKLEEE
ncbi:MAG: cyclic nucleotide-binding domain-containing protein [Anaerolineae bacterium]|nr:cyclic nucleotide-binding domain-containing protein [Anaerolineae bacterium]